MYLHMRTYMCLRVMYATDVLSQDTGPPRISTKYKSKFCVGSIFVGAWNILIPFWSLFMLDIFFLMCSCHWVRVKEKMWGCLCAHEELFGWLLLAVSKDRLFMWWRKSFTRKWQKKPKRVQAKLLETCTCRDAITSSIVHVKPMYVHM